MMEEVSELVGMNQPEVLDSRYVTEPNNDFLFPWEEAGPAEYPIAIDEDEGFSKTLPQNPLPQQPPAMQPQPALLSIENIQNSRQFFDF